MKRNLFILLALSALILVSCFAYKWWSLAPIRDLQDPNTRCREEAILRLWAREESHQAIPELIACFEDPSTSVRHLAVLALNNVGSKAIPHLRRALYSSRHQMRIGALKTFGLPDPRYRRRFSSEDDKGLLNCVLDCMGDVDAEIRECAARSLTWVALGAGEDLRGIHALFGAVSDTEPNVRVTAIYSLGMIVRYSKTHIDLQSIRSLFISCRSDANARVRRATEWALPELEDVEKRSQQRNE